MVCDVCLLSSSGTRRYPFALLLTELWTGIATDTVDGATAAAQELRKRGAKSVIVTLGERGALYCGEEGVWLVPAPSVQAVDSSGT